MKHVFLSVFALLIAGALPAQADGKIYVQLPDLTDYEGAAAEDLLSRVIMAGVVSSNCPDFAVTDAEWSLLTDAGDLLAIGQLRLDTDSYDEDYYGPAFDALDRPETCAVEGPKVEGVLEQLVTEGGSRDPLPDQDQAYEDWRALMDRLEAEAYLDAAPTAKTKVK